MKLFNSILLVLSLMVFSSCDMMYHEDEVPKSDDEFGSGPVVNPDDGNAVDSEINIDGRRRSGNPPNTSNTRYPPEITKYTPSITSTKDQLIFLPFEYECSPSADGPSAIYFQIEGANSYWQVEPTANSGQTGQLVLKLGLPGNISNGQFVVNYRIKDNLGAISNVVRTTVNIIDVALCDGSYFEGEDGLTVRSYDMGTSTSKVRVTYNMFNIPDRIDIYYDGKWVGGTGRPVPYGTLPPQSYCSQPQDGYVSGDSFFEFNYNANRSRRVDVYVSGCLNSSTSWNVWVECL